MAQQMTVGRWFVAATTAVVMLSSCIGGGSNEKSEPASDPLPIDAEQMESEGNAAGGSTEPIQIAEIEQIFDDLVECLEPDLNGYLRADFSRYVGMEGEYGLTDGARDEALVEKLFAECADSTGFEAGIGRFLDSNVLSSGNARNIDAELNRCAERAGVADDPRWNERSTPETIDAVVETAFLVPRSTDSALADDLLDCVQETVYGPRFDF